MGGALRLPPGDGRGGVLQAPARLRLGGRGRRRRRRRRSSPRLPPLELGALQEDWTLAPLSAWSLDEEGTGSGGGPGSIEFLVDEERRFPGLGPDDVRVHAVLEDGLVDYGTRQVGGGKGPGNPHGEESELVYYVARTAVEGEYCGRGRAIEVDLNPDLETLW